MAVVSTAEFEKALQALREAIEFSSLCDDQVFKIARDASIQRFEFCVELAWKVSAKLLGSSGTTTKPVLREMLQNGLITNIDQWFDFVDARNKSSHTYDEIIAKEVFEVVKGFLPEASELLLKMKTW